MSFLVLVVILVEFIFLDLVSCFGGFNGLVIVIVIGGIGELSYFWNDLLL